MAKLNAAGSALVYSTYLGGSNYDGGFGIAVDSSGNAYVTGYTFSANFPTVNPLQPTHGGGVNDAFVAKLNAAGSALAYSTYLGGGAWDEGDAIAVDSFGNAYVTGFTVSTDFPTVNPVQASNHGGDGDAFVAKLNAAGSALVYSTYLGSSGEEGNYEISAAYTSSGIAVDTSGNAYVTGITASTDFPTVNALQPNNAGGFDAFVAKISPIPAAGTGVAGGTTNPQQSVAEPVSTGNGNYLYQHTDLVIPGRGMPLVFQRSYNTLDNYYGPLGVNWTYSYNIFLTVTATGASIKWGDGHD